MKSVVKMTNLALTMVKLILMDFKMDSVENNIIVQAIYMKVCSKIMRNMGMAESYTPKPMTTAFYI